MIEGITWSIEARQYVGYDRAGVPHFDNVPEEALYKVQFADKFLPVLDLELAADVIADAVERARQMHTEECTCADEHPDREVMACPACLRSVVAQDDAIPWEV